MFSDLAGRRHRVRDDGVHLAPGQHLVVDERRLLAVEQDRHGVALVHVADHAGAEVLEGRGNTESKLE